MNGRKGQQCKCVCGGLTVKGDAKKWAEADDNEECVTCAGQWQSRVRPHYTDCDVPLDSVGIVQ